jgi:ERCC4-type nuclease
VEGGNDVIRAASIDVPAARSSMEPKLPIVADDREARAGVLGALRAREDCDVAVRRLALADYLVAGRLLVERKTWPDLIASIVDGRLFGQACRLAASPLPSVLLIEGREATIDASPVSREALLGALVSVSVVLGVPVLRSRDADETARLIVYAGRQLRRVVAGAVPRPGFRPRSKRRLQLHLLQGLPGVGPARAARLLDRYGSVEAVVTAAEGVLTQVAGLGRRWRARSAGPSANRRPNADGQSPNPAHRTVRDSEDRYSRR